MISLPIPSEDSNIAYEDIEGNHLASVGELVKDLSAIKPMQGANLDPDLSFHSIPRDAGWKPLFGQVGRAEKHLENEGVNAGDVFLFFGRF